MQFTYSAYENLIRLSKDRGYRFVGFGDGLVYGRSIILRHDVDFDLEKALTFSAFENELGVSSTYMILVSSDFYNVFSKESREHLRGILANGHSIGLHFDETQYEDKNKLIECINNELRLLGEAIGEGVKTISMHRPSKMILDRNIEIDGIENSYSKKYFSEIKYISDSRRCWKEDVFSIIDSKMYDYLQILTHPIWYSDNNIDAKKALEEFVVRKKKRVVRGLDDNIRDLNELVGVNNISNWI